MSEWIALLEGPKNRNVSAMLLSVPRGRTKRHLAKRYHITLYSIIAYTFRNRRENEREREKCVFICTCTCGGRCISPTTLCLTRVLCVVRSEKNPMNIEQLIDENKQLRALCVFLPSIRCPHLRSWTTCRQTITNYHCYMHNLFA
jgi:hypothetical protein